MLNKIWKFEEKPEKEIIYSLRGVLPERLYYRRVRLEFVEFQNNHDILIFKVKSKNEYFEKLCFSKRDSLLWRRCSYDIKCQIKPGTWIEVEMRPPWIKNYPLGIPYIVRSRAKHRKTITNDKN